jgi:hypothetical protein
VGTIDFDYLVRVSDVIKLIESGKNRLHVLNHKTHSEVYVTVAQKGDLKCVRIRDYDTHYDELLKVGECSVTNRPQYESASIIIHGIRDLLDR